MCSQCFEALSGWCVPTGPPPSAVLLVWRAVGPILPLKFRASIASLVIVSLPRCKATYAVFAWCQMTAYKSFTCYPFPFLSLPPLPSLSCCWLLSWNNFLLQNVSKSVVFTVFQLSLSRAGLPSLPPFVTWNCRQLNNIRHYYILNCWKKPLFLIERSNFKSDISLSLLKTWLLLGREIELVNWFSSCCRGFDSLLACKR